MNRIFFNFLRENSEETDFFKNEKNKKMEKIRKIYWI
jgi:hypothetical protein